ncbi:DUF6338 family protein [Knoellia sp. CPCC 206450]|uniref:DUF6338 family protein n=1 Tax=Knoellia tibetensis TaxID=3404798 RepID=UPI003B43626C
MSIPDSITQVLVTLVLVIPGFVFQIVRIRMHGRSPADEEITTRILTAIAISTIFALVYVGVIGSDLTNSGDLQVQARLHPRRWAILGLLAAFVVPAVVACAYSWARQREWWAGRDSRFTRLFDRLTRIDPRPTAWDVAFNNLSECFVRVRTRDGTWYAGWFGGRSYASSYPDPHTLFVEVAIDIDENGKLGAPIEGSTGAVIDCSNADWIELLVSPEQVESGTMVGTEVPQ